MTPRVWGRNAGEIPYLHLKRDSSMCSFVLLARLHEGINAASWRCVSEIAPCRYVLKL